LVCLSLALGGCGAPAAGEHAATPTLKLAGPQPATTPTKRPTVATTAGLPRIGGEAADFLLPDLAGNEVALSDLRGKVVLLNFFATWCPPCNAELPHLMAQYEEYQDQGLEVVAVDQAEARATVKRFVAENKIPFTVLLDTNATTSRLYNARSIPRSLFIDAEGIIRIDHVGYMSEDVLRGYIEQMLEK
jgi:peroxiredoxin